MCFAIILAEAALRIVGFSNPYLFVFENQTGWTLRPNTAGWIRKEGSAYIRVNSQGLRDDSAHSKRRPTNTLRIAVLGDSFVEAVQVPTEQTFVKLLEIDLSKCQNFAGSSFEVLNFGVSNYGTAQERLVLETRVWEYKPQFVVLVTPANDIRNNSRELERDDLRPYFVYRDGKLVADFSFRDSSSHRQKMSRINNALHSAINHSRLLQLLNNLKEILQARQSAGASSLTIEAGLDDQAFIPPKDEKWRDAWRVTEGIISEINTEVRRHGARFLVVSGTFGPQVDPDDSRRRAFTRRLGVSHLLYAAQRISALGSKEGFPVLDLVPAFQEYATKNQTPLHGFNKTVNQGHWNVAGHRLVSSLIADRMCKLTP